MFQSIIRQFLDSKTEYLAELQYKKLGSKFGNDWRKFPKFKVQVQLRYDSKSQNHSKDNDCFDGLETFGMAVVTFNVLHMAILMRKNHILDLVLQTSLTGTDLHRFVEIDYPGFDKNPARSWISAANALHLASKFNPKALYIILSKMDLQNKDNHTTQSFWDLSSKKFGFSPLHSAATNPDALSAR